MWAGCIKYLSRPCTKPGGCFVNGCSPGGGHGNYIEYRRRGPDEDSVTRAFYEAGWRGVNVVPMSPLAERPRHRRPDDINLSVAVGAAPVSALFIRNSGSRQGQQARRKPRDSLHSILAAPSRPAIRVGMSVRVELRSLRWHRSATPIRTEVILFFKDRCRGFRTRGPAGGGLGLVQTVDRCHRGDPSR